MRRLEGDELREAEKYMHSASLYALTDSLCLRARCGSIIVKDKRVIGKGYNAPPCDVKLEKCLKDDLPDDFKSDIVPQLGFGVHVEPYESCSPLSLISPVSYDILLEYFPFIQKSLSILDL